MLKSLKIEKWDLYNAERVPLNVTIFRGEAHSKGTYHIVVNAWIFNSHGEILVTLRHPGKLQFPSMWENQGGAAQHRETSLEAIIRELQEETGILAAPQELTLLGTSLEKTAIVDIYALHKNIDISEIVLQNGETVDAKWVTMSEFNRMISKGVVSGASVRRKAAVQEELDRYYNMVFNKNIP